MAAAKLGMSRKIVIPKDVCEKLGLEPGDYVDFNVRNSTVIMKRKTAIDRELEEAKKEIRQGKFIGPFDNAADAMRALRGKSRG